MPNIIKATVSITGLRPLLWHHFGPDAIPLEKQERTGVAGNDPEEWKKSVLMTAERQLYILPTYVFGCLRNAAKFTKKGKGSIQSDVSATLQVTDDIILVDRFVPDVPVHNARTEPVYIDISSVKNPATKARNVRYRVAASSGWKLSFNLLWDKTIVNRSQMEAVVNDAGVLVGLGDGRSIGFGRFELNKFEVKE